MVAEVVRASKIGEQSPNQLPAPPVEVFTTTVSNVLEWLVAETTTKSVTLSSVGVDNRSYMGEGGGGEFGNATGVLHLQFCL